MNKLRVGVIGCGRIAKSHLEHLQEMPQVHVVAVCDTIPKRAQEVARRFGTSTFRTYQELLDCPDIDAVFVCTPTTTHADLGCAVMRSGRHLFIEKPLALTQEESQRLVAEAQRSGVITSVGLQWRYLEGVSRAQEVLGDYPVTLIRGWYYWTWPMVGWIVDRRTGGGQMMDQGIHLLDLARIFGGELSELYARFTLMARKGDGFPNWDSQVMVGQFQSGALLNIAVTYASFPQFPDISGLEVVAKDRVMRITPSRTTKFDPQGEVAWYESQSAMARADQSFVEACLTNHQSLVRSSIGDAARSLEVVLASTESAESGAVYHFDVQS